MKKPKQDPQEVALMRVMSGFFDPVWYGKRYPDVANVGIDPLLHFIRHGVVEGRDPNRFFDGSWYLEHYPDVAAAGYHPLVHYLQAGARELRNPHPRFDAAWYVQQHPEAAENPLLYHIKTGASLGYDTEKPLYLGDYLPSGNAPLPVPPDIAVDVVIPVYRGLRETRVCIRSVLADTSYPLRRVIVVDDCSPDAKLRLWLDRLAAAGRIMLIRNRRNQGFVRSVNTGMEAAGGNDVVLLNSDTQVPAGWLSRLAAQAYAEPDIATVSPLSNNATICGYPGDQGGPIAFGASLGDVDTVCQQVNAGRFVTTPTTVGFCMYITRAALDQVGNFDAERFGLGYGEENDFCLRATELGWQHRIACDTFVYHKGSVSFGTQSNARAGRAMARLRKQYPRYEEAVAWHVDQDAIGPFRFALTAALIARSGLPVILMVSHELGGGVGRHIDTLVQSLSGLAHVLLLRSSPRGVVLSVPALTGHPTLAMPEERVEDLVRLLRHCNVGRVHLHHLMGMDLDARLLIHRLDVPFDVTVHDYYAICPQVNLLPSPTSLYCGEPGMAGCNACIAARPSHGARDILSWRAERAWQFREADRVICPSHDVLTRLRRYGLDASAIVVPHQPVTDPAWPLAAAPPVTGKLRIAVLGVLADHKGARSVAAVAEQADPASIEIHVIGYTEDDFPEPALPWLKVTGAYQEPDLSALIETIAPHILWFPAAWPETFSYTLSVAIESRLPIVATQIGAFPERLAGRPMTWMADPAISPAGWIALFNEIRSAPGTSTPTAPRETTDDFYARDYLRVEPPSRPAYPKRLRASRPLIAIVPERFDTGGPTPCGYIRLLQPLTHPAIAGDCDIILADAKSVLDYDVDIIATHRYAIPDIRAADLLHQHARRSGARLLYDLDDDLLRIAPTHPEAAELRPLAKVVRRMLAHADTVWVSTPYLADALRSTRRDTVIMPNGLDERLWTGPVLPRRAEHTPIRILCMGTTTHIRDFALIAPALTRIKKEFGSAVEIDVIGMTAGDSFPEGVNRLGLPNAATQSYPGFVNWMNSQLPGWDVGLTPLLETPFNLSKSYIKTMDYAALGMAVLASDMPVYRGSLADGPAGRLVANDPRAWYAELNWLVRNPALVRTMAAAARPAFLGRATLASQGEARRTALLDLLRQPQPAACAADAAG